MLLQLVQVEKVAVADASFAIKHHNATKLNNLAEVLPLLGLFNQPNVETRFIASLFMFAQKGVFAL